MKTSLKKMLWTVMVWAGCLGVASLAEANILVKSIIVNTSASSKKTIPFKAYLPKEIKPENVVDLGGLEIAFDTKEGVYYVFRDYELGPKEVANVEVELEDVWRIPEAEIKMLRQETEKVTKMLANTDYYERAIYLKNTIDSKLNQVEHTQAVGNPSPAGYISDYRENVALIESVKADLAAARALVAQARSIAPLLTWRLIIAIIAFLGFLGLIFFFVWQKQIKSLAKLTEDFEGALPVGLGGEQEAEEGERREVGGERPRGISDIEERLKEKP